jgi:hypothetical protein
MHHTSFRPRFTVRRLMTAVAIVAVVLAAWLKSVPYWELSRQYQERVGFFELSARGQVGRIECYEILIAGKQKDPDSEVFTFELMQDQVKTARVWLDYYRGLTAKYKRAARCPWLPVEPDPPDPNGGETYQP